MCWWFSGKNRKLREIFLEVIRLRIDGGIFFQITTISPRSALVIIALSHLFAANFLRQSSWLFCNYRVLSPVRLRRRPWTMLPLYAEWTGWAVTTRNIARLLGCCSAVWSRKSRNDKIRWNGRYRFDLASARYPFGTLHLVNLRRPQNRLACLPLMPK